MRKIFLLPVAGAFFCCCTNAKKEVTEIKNNKVSLRADTTNVVKLTDTLIIYESTCRGCAYEGSTRFDIVDSLKIVKLVDVITTDNSSPGMNGGSISKDLILAPQKTGTTRFKLYKFWSEKTAAEDSARFRTYAIEVQN